MSTEIEALDRAKAAIYSKTGRLELAKIMLTENLAKHQLIRHN